MALRSDASGENARRTTNLPALSAFTLAGWGYRYANRASEFQYFAGLENATSSSSGYLLLGWTDINTFDFTSDGGNVSISPAPAVGTWFYWFIRSNGANSYQAGWKPSGGSWTVVTLAATLTWTPAMLPLLNDSYNEWCDMAVERVRCWDAALTNTELDNELASATPVRSANLRANWPLVSDGSETVNGYSLTTAGAVSYEAGPFGASGISGAAAITLGAVTSAGAGTVAIAGAGAGTLGATTLSAAGSVSSGGVGGTASLTLTAIAASGAGTVAVAGAASKTLGAVTASGAGAVAVTGTSTRTLGAVTLTASGLPITGATVGGVLTVSSANGRYFANAAGPLLLAGFHTWASIQDSWPTTPITALDFDAYLAALVAYGANFTKAWFLESARDWEDSAQWFAPHPWARTGPGNAADGLPKFDLATFNQAYFDRLRERVIRLGNAGIYVDVMLFQGWSIARPNGGTAGNPWAYHPFNAANNINGINGDTNSDGSGYETRATSFTAVYNLQKAYVAKVLDTLNDLDNVLYEIANEEATASLPWQQALVDYIKSYEAGKPKQHPVGITVPYPGGSNSALYAISTIDWLSPNGDYTPDAASAAKVSLFDTDHITGLTAEYKWVHRALCQGHNLAYMDEWAGETYANDTRNVAAYQRIRANLGRALAYASRFDLGLATPQGSLSSTGYCLVQTTGAARLLAYQDNSGAFTVNLAGLPGTFALEWLRTAATTPTTQSGGTVQGGATRTLTPPWAGEDALALLELTGTNGAASITVGAVTVAAAGTVATAGSATITLGALAVTAAGAVAVVGAAALQVGAATASAAGVTAITGAAALVLVATNVAAAGAVAIGGAGAPQLGAVTATGAGTAAIAGAAAMTLAALAVEATGAVGSVPTTGAASIQLGAVTVAGAGVTAVTGAASITLGAVATTAQGAAAVTGAAALVLGALTIQGEGFTGAVPVVGAAALFLAPMTVAAGGAVAVTGAGAIALDALSVAAAGQGVNAGQAALALGAMAASAAGAVAVTAAAALALDAMTLAAAGSEEAPPDVVGTASITLGAMTATGAGIVRLVLVLGRITGPGGAGTVSGPKTSSSIGV